MRNGNFLSLFVEEENGDPSRGVSESDEYEVERLLRFEVSAPEDVRLVKPFEISSGAEADVMKHER